MFSLCIFLGGLTPTKTLGKDDRRGFLLFNQEGFKLMQKVGKFFVCLFFFFSEGANKIFKSAICIDHISMPRKSKD